MPTTTQLDSDRTMEQWRSYVLEVVGGTKLAETPELVLSVAGMQSHTQNLRTAWDMLRRSNIGGGRYSPRTLNELVNMADGVTPDAGTRVVLVGYPYTLDPMTEVKRGGWLGVAVNMADGRVLLAVAATARRKRIGRLLADAATMCLPDGSYGRTRFWVHRSNIAGQAFLANLGLAPNNITRGGSIEYAPIYLDDDDEPTA